MGRKQTKLQGMEWLRWFAPKLNRFLKQHPLPKELLIKWPDTYPIPQMLELGKRAKSQEELDSCALTWVICWVAKPMALHPETTVSETCEPEGEYYLTKNIFLDCYAKAPDFMLALTAEIRRIAGPKGFARDRAASVIFTEWMFGTKTDKEIVELLKSRHGFQVDSEVVKKIRQEAARPGRSGIRLG